MLSSQILKRIDEIEEKLMLEVDAANSKKSSNMVALLTPFAATSNGCIFPHVRCSSAMHDLQQMSS
jgi:alkyl hydroperoxide reductase subunit AhpF